MKHPRLHTEGEITADPESCGNAVGEDKTDTINIPRERIRIVLDPSNGVQAVEPVDFER